MEKERVNHFLIARTSMKRLYPHEPPEHAAVSLGGLMYGGQWEVDTTQSDTETIAVQRVGEIAGPVTLPETTHES